MNPALNKLQPAPKLGTPRTGYIRQANLVSSKQVIPVRPSMTARIAFKKNARSYVK